MPQPVRDTIDEWRWPVNTEAMAIDRIITAKAGRRDSFLVRLVGCSDHKPQGDEVGDRLRDQLQARRMLGHRTAPFLLLRLGVPILLGLGHPVEAHG